MGVLVMEKVKRIVGDTEVELTMLGSETKEADIVVYNDDECEETYILVECKKEDFSLQYWW
jgi:type I restriction enzyme M protein